MLQITANSVRKFSSLKNIIKVSDAVQKGLQEGKGVVALESTVITHGLPYPTNLETARSLEDIVKSEGAVPATIAFMDGQIHVGLQDSQLEEIAQCKNAIKVSKRDMARTIATKSVGGTTVAATMWVAHRAGISVFSTGGIGGVHRGADQTFDISADLIELSETPVVVVCAGVKSILDIAKTVEYLETHSVNTIVYGKQNSFPGFFTAETSSKGQMNTTNLNLIADVIKQSKSLGLPAGTVLACPIPAEHQAEGGIIEKAIQKALKESVSRQISGQATTPFLLGRVKELTKGASMKTNVALLQNNARIGARLANTLAKRQFSTSPASNEKQKPLVVTIGAAISDFEAITHENVKDDGGSYKGIVEQRSGGVGRNHADALARLGCISVMITAFGNDENGTFLKRDGPHIDFTRADTIDGIPSAVYMSMNIKGNVKYGISSIEEIVRHITPQLIKKNADVIATADFVVLDGNLGVDAMKTAIDIASAHGRKVWYEPTDIAKMQKIFACDGISKITACSPNANEFKQLCIKSGLTLDESLLKQPKYLAEWILENSILMYNMECLVVSLAEIGCVVLKRNSINETSATILPPPINPNEVVSVSGAGDCFNSGLLAGWVHGLKWPECLRLAQSTAALTLRTTHAVSKDIKPISL